MAVMQPTTLTAAALAALVATTGAHMVMNTPTPYNLHGTAKLVQVNPLGVGFPFPCQGLSDAVSVTPVTAGTSQLVRFTGGAQHGGGSCQFSLTYDFPPPADKARWKTIYTLIGGCPVSAAGNLPVAGRDADGRADGPHCGNDSGRECIRQFDVPVPKALPNGNATFAWTWFNKIGNREMYMNCAPVSITGGSDDRVFFESLPNMFVANVPGECSTGNGVLNIPNPGSFGRVLEQPAGGSEGTCAKASGVPAFGSGNGGGGGAGAPHSSSLVNSPPTPTTPSTSASSAAATSGFVTRTTSGSGGAESTPAASSAPVHSANPGFGGSGSGSGAGSGQACSPNGALICFSATSFGLCANGVAIPQPVAAGTTCNNGQIVRRSAKFVFGK